MFVSALRVPGGAGIVSAMSWLAAPLLVLVALAQPATSLPTTSLPTTSGLHDLVATVPGVGPVLYGLSVPPGYDTTRATPLVVVLHPGGTRMRYYGSAFVRTVVEPGLRELHAIMIAPDCTAASWEEPACENSVMALVASAMATYNIDRRRILITGFSMGGRGTWSLASRHRDLFTAAIPMAAPTGTLSPDDLAAMPTYVIHSRDDEVVPFGPAERNAQQLERAGRVIHFDAVSGLRHYEMVNYVDAVKRAATWIAARWQ
jgi:predicted peptidase